MTAATQAAIDDFTDGLLAYESRAANIVAAADADPGHGLANAYAGILHLLGEAPGSAAAAAPYLAAAEVAVSAGAHEVLVVAALRRWVDDDIDGTVAAFEALLTAFPGDLVALKLLHYHLFNRGDFPAMLRAALAATAAVPGVPYVHGMLAFAYEQCHLLDDAEAAARRALGLTDREPWAQHALAHVMLTQGRIDEGVAFLEAARPGWTGLNSFMITHLWWHLGLFYLSQGRNADALAAYDDQMWAFARDYSQDQIGAVSMLARLELAGADVGGRWDDVAAYLALRTGDVVQPFLTVQYLYGLARAGRPEADQLLATIVAAGEGGAPHSRAVWRDVALPLARGLVAHARGEHAAASTWFGEALPRLLRIGGSHAQRDLFEQLALDADIRSGRLVEAQQTLELRRGHDPDGVALNRQLARVYTALGLPAQAAEVEARIRRRLA